MDAFVCPYHPGLNHVIPEAEGESTGEASNQPLIAISKKPEYCGNRGYSTRLAGGCLSLPGSTRPWSGALLLLRQINLT